MLQPLNVYRHDDGHYLLAPGPDVDAMHDAHVAWLGIVDLDALAPMLREAICEQLRLNSHAQVTAAQFYAPAHSLRAPH